MDVPQQPNPVKQAIQLAQQALDAGNKSAALEILEHALKQYPESEVVLGLLGIMHRIMNAPEKSITSPSPRHSFTKEITRSSSGGWFPSAIIWMSPHHESLRPIR